MQAFRLSALCALALAVSSPAAQATSAASASLSFNVTAGPGFAWLANPVSAADSAATVAAFEGFEPVAGVFGPVYAAPVSAFDLRTGLGIPGTTAAVSTDELFGNAATAGAPTSATLTASALVPASGKADATSFARSWFSLEPGATVTFQGAVLLSMTGSNPAFPANYSLGDFYGFASGLLAVGSDEALVELGGPAATGGAGGYSLNTLAPLSLTLTNTTGSLLVTYLDSGVTVYSASVVPEPGTYALLLAGLGAIVFTVRRKSAHR